MPRQSQSCAPQCVRHLHQGLDKRKRRQCETLKLGPRDRHSSFCQVDSHCSLC